jgi:hypothetical protein
MRPRRVAVFLSLALILLPVAAMALFTEEAINSRRPGPANAPWMDEQPAPRKEPESAEKPAGQPFVNQETEAPAPAPAMAPAPVPSPAPDPSPAPAPAQPGGSVETPSGPGKPFIIFVVILLAVTTAYVAMLIRKASRGIKKRKK